jgi:hypothetical protein
MRGQWAGAFEATPGGGIVINVDELESCYEGTAYLNPVNSIVPKSEVIFRTTNKDVGNIKFTTNVMFPLHPVTYQRARWDDIKHMFADDALMSTSADVEGKVADDKLTLSWKTDIGLDGRCSLSRSQAGEPSVLASETVSWDDFKRRVWELGDNHRFIFRGQKRPWRLRTSFHRQGRVDLRRFLDEDIPLLYKHLSARTRHLFNLRDAQQNAAFISLAQHHGYPTNPYVAAFFAFRGVSQQEVRGAKPGERVRIHVFDSGLWTRTTQQLLSITSPILNVSLIDPLAIENERLIPQQAVAVVSSVDDIETHIRGYETNGRVLLRALDMPIAERNHVMNELRYMGITAGALFPGLDGSCEELKERNFRY